MLDGYYPQVKQLDIGEVLRTGSAIQSRNVMNRLNQMKLRDIERKAAKTEGMNILAKQYARPAQQGPAGGAPLQPASFDQPGYVNALMQQYPQEGMKAQQTLQEREDKEFTRITEIAKVDPQMATRVFNSSPFGKKYGQIKFKETKGNLQIFEDKMGGLSSVDKNTGEYKVIKEPRKGKSLEERKLGLEERKFEYEKKKGPKKAYTEATARKRISGIQGAIARLQSGDKFENALAAMSPELRSILGAGTDGGAKLSREEAIRALEEERTYVETFLPKVAPFEGRSMSDDMGGAIQASPQTSAQGDNIISEAIQAEIKRRGLKVR